MLKIRNTGIRIFLSLLLLTMGNFTSALAHFGCSVSESGHVTCEMVCCSEDSRGEDEYEGTLKITDENGSCCETHIEQAVEQDNAVLVVNKPVDNLKHSVRTFTLCFDTLLCSEGFSAITHKFKTTNIPIELSNLRI